MGALEYMDRGELDVPGRVHHELRHDPARQSDLLEHGRVAGRRLRYQHRRSEARLRGGDGIDLVGGGPHLGDAADRAAGYAALDAPAGEVARIETTWLRRRGTATLMNRKGFCNQWKSIPSFVLQTGRSWLSPSTTASHASRYGRSPHSHAIVARSWMP